MQRRCRTKTTTGVADSPSGTVDEEEDYRPRRTTPADHVLPQESAEDPAAITVLVDEQGAVSDVAIPARWRDVVRPRDLGRVLLEAVNKAIANRVTSQVE